MAKVKRPEMKQDAAVANSLCPSCGKPTMVHMNVSRGNGRVACSSGCGWDDKSPVGARASETPDSPHVSDRNVVTTGVQIIGRNEAPRGVEILGGNR